MQQSHPEAVQYLDGFAVHWYWDNIAPPSLLDKTHEKFPDKFILNTESCLGMMAVPYLPFLPIFHFTLHRTLQAINHLRLMDRYSAHGNELNSMHAHISR